MSSFGPRRPVELLPCVLIRGKKPVCSKSVDASYQGFAVLRYLHRQTWIRHWANGCKGLCICWGHRHDRELPARSHVGTRVDLDHEAFPGESDLTQFRYVPYLGQSVDRQGLITQRTHVLTHAAGLVMRRILDMPEQGGLGLRRCQWKTTSLNLPSQNAAKRLGYTPEGVLRAAQVLDLGKEGIRRECPDGRTVAKS